MLFSPRLICFKKTNLEKKVRAAPGLEYRERMKMWLRLYREVNSALYIKVMYSERCHEVDMDTKIEDANWILHHDNVPPSYLPLDRWRTKLETTFLPATVFSRPHSL
jgi:hypothetical protein